MNQKSIENINLRFSIFTTCSIIFQYHHLPYRPALTLRQQPDQSPWGGPGQWDTHSIAIYIHSLICGPIVLGQQIRLYIHGWVGFSVGECEKCACAQWIPPALLYTLLLCYHYLNQNCPIITFVKKTNVRRLIAPLMTWDWLLCKLGERDTVFLYTKKGRLGVLD